MNLRFLRAISFRIAIIFSLSTISILILMGVMIHQLVIRHFEHQDRLHIDGNLQLIKTLLEQNPRNSPELLLYLQDALAEQQGMMIQIERPIGHLLFNSDPVVLDTQKLVQPPSRPWLEWHIEQRSYRGLMRKLYRNGHGHPPTASIIVGIDTSDDQQICPNGCRFSKSLPNCAHWPSPLMTCSIV
jgi:two-component system heavy metal sensor histidine kinase CusS